MFNSKTASSYDDSIFAREPRLQRHTQVPPLAVSFDTETTGLPVDEKVGGVKTGRKIYPDIVSYALTVYRHGKQDGPSETFIVKPAKEVDPGAEAVNGWSRKKLLRSYRGEIVDDLSGNVYEPAVHQKVGLNTIVQRLGDLQKQGAKFVGANVKGFDFKVLQDHYERLHRMPLKTSGFDPDTADIIDVIRHHQVMNNHPDTLRHPLSPSSRPGSKPSLCEIYGVEPGDHTAAADTRATMNVFLKQVEANNRRFKTSKKISSIGASGINYALAVPCSSDKECGFCKHLDELHANNRDESGKVIDKDTHAMVKRIKKIHNNMAKASPEENGIAYAPSLAKAAKKRRIFSRKA